MRHPGIFFLPRTSIRRASRRFNSWWIERRESTTVRLWPFAEKRQFHRRLEELFASDVWTPGVPIHTGKKPLCDV